jgi:branched-chain amino acid transport system permease protein
MTIYRNTIIWIVLIVGALLFPIFVKNNFLLFVASQAFILVIATLGLNLITGYTGQLNLAHGGFMALGAYAVAILTVDYSISYWAAFASAILIVLFLGVPVGYISLRLKGNYFAIFTLCIGIIIYYVIEKWDSMTHGALGIRDIPNPEITSLFKLDNPLSQYYLILFFLVAGYFLMRRITKSILGRAFVAIRNSDELAEALGINLMRTKLLSFLISVAYAAIAGALYAGQVRVVTPELANEVFTFDFIMYMVVGGVGTLLGPLIGTFLVITLTQSLQFLQHHRLLVFAP